MSTVRRLLRAPALLRRLALASLLANVGLVVTGGAVRLTGSGLGCPTWPRCSAGSYVTTSEMGVHWSVEFGNRTLGVAVGLLALACVVVAAYQPTPRRPLVFWSVLVLAGIPAQAVIGGITVLTRLNPWIVGCHFLASAAVIAAAYQLTIQATAAARAPAPARPPAAAVPVDPDRRPVQLARPLVLLARLVVLASAAVLAAGTVVTGSGPHAGDATARRTGLDPQGIAQIHADLVFLLIGLSTALWFALRAVNAPAGPRRAAAWLLGAELAQATIGFVQYLTHLPAPVVELHLLGAALVWLAALGVLDTTRTAEPPPVRSPVTATAMSTAP
ncbi:MAG: heme a synthase [Micromonosporaceae bacterium]|nr:heme a synthase [Micromonosporaceae bacterium]